MTQTDPNDRIAEVRAPTFAKAGKEFEVTVRGCDDGGGDRVNNIKFDVFKRVEGPVGLWGFPVLNGVLGTEHVADFGGGFIPIESGSCGEKVNPETIDEPGMYEFRYGLADEDTGELVEGTAKSDTVIVLP